MRISEEKSSLLSNLTYDQKSKTLTVTYREDGARFSHTGISKGLFDRLKESKHPGRVWSTIRHIYPHKQV
jgi:KTSC domain